MPKLEALVATRTSLLFLSALLTLLVITGIQTTDLFAKNFAHLFGCFTVDLVPLIFLLLCLFGYDFSGCLL